MFDLFRSRDKAVRYVLTAILSLVALSMVAYLIPGGPGSGASDSTGFVLAEVGDEKLTVREVQQALQLVMQQQNLNSQMLQFLVPQLVEQLITERAVVYEAQRMGFQVTDVDTANSIRAQLPQLFQDGQFIGKEAYANVLSRQNMSIADFEAYMRRQLLLNRLRSIVLEGIVVSDLDVELEYKLRNDKATAEYVKLDPVQFMSKVDATAAEVSEFYNQNKANYRIPEKKSFAILLIDPAAQQDAAGVTDAEVQRAYNENMDRYRIPEQVHVRHILLNTVDKPEDQIAGIEKRANEVLAQVRGGVKFDDAARRNSEDPTTKDKGGDLGFIGRGRTVPEFESVAFALKPGEIAPNVVKTQYGFHILQVLAKQDARLRPLEEVQAELRSEIIRERAQARMATFGDDVERALRATPSDYEGVASRFKLEVARAENAAPGDPIPFIGVSSEFATATHTLAKGGVSTLLPAAGGRQAIAVVTGTVPERQAELSEVEATVKSGVITTKANAMLEQKANQLAARAKELNGDLKKAAQELGFSVVTSPEFTRTGAIEGLGSADSVPGLFSTQVGSILGPLPFTTSRVVIRLSSRTNADMAALASQRAAIREEIKQKRARERNALFEDGLRRGLENDGKLKINKDAVQRIIQSNIRS